MNQSTLLHTLETLPLSDFKNLSRTRFKEILNSQTKSPFIKNLLPSKSPIAFHSESELAIANSQQNQIIDALTEEIFYEIIGHLANKLMEEKDDEL